MCAASEATKKREGVSQAVTAMKQRGGAVQYVDKHELNMVTDNRLHQVWGCTFAATNRATVPILFCSVVHMGRCPALVLGWYRGVQGLVLDCSPLDWERLEEFEEAAKASHASPAQLPVWLALDEIGDPVRLLMLLGPCFARWVH